MTGMVGNTLENPYFQLLLGDCREKMKELPDCSVQTCVTSPPYFSLRNYGGNDKEIGTEKEVDDYVNNIVEVFREVKRVLRDDGTLWLNLGDSYNGSGGQGTKPKIMSKKAAEKRGGKGIKCKGLKPRDLIGIPWSVAFALRADGWYLRGDNIWCLSGGTWLYAKTQTSTAPMMMKDIYRLTERDIYKNGDEKIRLWNGKKWTNVVRAIKTPRKGDEIEITLRSGERISSSQNHRFPTINGLVRTKDLKIGDILESSVLPDEEFPLDCVLDEDAAWLSGIYLAEGSISGSAIQIAGHAKETHRWEKLNKIAKKFGGTITRDLDGNTMNIRLYGNILHAIIKEFVSGWHADTKCFSAKVWKYSNAFLKAYVDGYLAGDGHDDKGNKRWRLGFCRNYSLERDLRTACARLGYNLTLNMATSCMGEKKFPSFRGEIRTERSGHLNEKNRNEIVKIQKSKCQFLYDLEVEDEPHVFALASGILTHNSKKNCMPESVRNRCTKSHEYVFLLTKSEKYFYDWWDISEKSVSDNPISSAGYREEIGRGSGNREANNFDEESAKKPMGNRSDARKNRRTVWTIATATGNGDDHYAIMPPELASICIRAGTSAKGCCYNCGTPWQREIRSNVEGLAPIDPIERNGMLLTPEDSAIVDYIEKNSGDYRITLKGQKHEKLWTGESPITGGRISHFDKKGYSLIYWGEGNTSSWEPGCECTNRDAVEAWDIPGVEVPPFPTIPCLVLDPFSGAATTGMESLKIGRSYVGVELNPKYLENSRKKLATLDPMFIEEKKCRT